MTLAPANRALLPQHMPTEIFLFSHYPGYKLETKVFAILKRNSMHLNKTCIAIAENYSNAKSTYLTWAILLLTIPSASQSCHCLRRAPCHGPMSKERVQLHVHRPSLTPPSCALCGDQPRPCLIPELQDLALQGSPAALAWAAFVHPGGMVGEGDASSGFQKQEYSCSPSIFPLFPRFLSSPVPALQVSWSSAKVIQLANPANNDFHFFFASPAVCQCSSGSPLPVGQPDTSAVVQCRENPAAEEGSGWLGGGSGITPCSSSECWACPVSHLA